MFHIDAETNCIHQSKATSNILFKMWFDDDEEVLALAAAALSILTTKRKKKRKHIFWVLPALQERSECGGLRLLSALKKDDLLSQHISDGHVQNFIRMSSSDLEWLLGRVEPIIRKADTNYRAAISSLERLLLTLRFFATGDSYHYLMYSSLAFHKHSEPLYNSIN